MHISLSNVGNIKSAAIEIKGITVIAGENGTGKSTAGKALFSAFSIFHDYKSVIRDNRIQSITLRLRTMENGVIVDYVKCREWAEQILQDYENGSLISREYLESLLDIDRNVTEDNELSDDGLDNVKKRIQAILEKTDDDVLKAVATNVLNAEFNRQSKRIGTNENGEILLCIKDKWMGIRFDEQQVLSIEEPVALRTSAVYIDDPFVLDEVNSRIQYRRASNDGSHRADLRNRLLQESNNNIIDELITNEHFERIYGIISKVCDGDIFAERGELWEKRTKSDGAMINIHNLSTGMKSFVILKLLLMNGALEPDGTIIMDEPEIHLHPEWQVIFAELIVLLQKEFNMHILLNTHSPYFLRAIQVYAGKHGIADRCDYYISENDEEQATITKVTDNIERIYQKLAHPIQMLEDERWANG